MTDIDQEIAFLSGEIRSLRGRIGSTGNAVQRDKLDMLQRIRARLDDERKALAKRSAA